MPCGMRSIFSARSIDLAEKLRPFRGHGNHAGGEPDDLLERPLLFGLLVQDRMQERTQPQISEHSRAGHWAAKSETRAEDRAHLRWKD